MMFVELFVSEGALDTTRRRALADRLITELIGEEGAPEVVLAGARALTQVVVHEPAAWVTGGPPDDKPRYLVRLTVPGSWNGKEMGGHLIPRITRALAEFDADPERLYREPCVWVQLIGLREGSLGTFGAPISSTDITKLITREYRESGAHAVAAEPGTAIDPVCGMTVALDGAAITLEHQGTTYAFCAAVCRKIFAEEHAVPA